VLLTVGSLKEPLPSYRFPEDIKIYAVVMNAPEKRAVSGLDRRERRIEPKKALSFLPFLGQLQAGV
jgi:hypothetical protein